MAIALPLILAAGGSVVQGVQQKNAADYNSAVYAEEAKTAATQGYAAEANQRRQNAQTIGRMVAGAGQAGAGYGGSTGRVIQQSAQNAELDALNIRYKAQLQKWAYANQASNIEQAGVTESNASMIRAGAALLKGYGNYRNPGNDLG